ncbi:MAG: response regulator [Spirochaetes bacterium]|nr:response regulator [Spirochaetota bacterium]
MDQKRILLVEDSASIRKGLVSFLKEAGYNIESAENGKAALEILKSDNIQLVITDLEMPVMGGSELIDNISAMEDQPVIIVLTSHDNADLIVNIMKKGVFDYLIKPVKKNDFLIRIQNAFKVSELDRMKRISEKEKVIRLEHQLEWYKLIEKMNNKNVKLKESHLFENLQRSFNQGSGIGVMLSLIDLITTTAKKKGNVYEINEKILDELLKNQGIVYKTMQTFADIEQITSSEIELKKVLMIDIYDIVKKSIEELQGLALIKSHNLILSEIKKIFNNIEVNINESYFKKLVEELIINAMKYSEKNSNIVVMVDYLDNNAVLSVINSINSSEDDGIPMEYENIVFEPFFRKIKYVQEQYKTMDYGLGLTFVERIVKKHNGRVLIHNIKDYSDYSKTSITKVRCQVMIPKA